MVNTMEWSGGLRPPWSRGLEDNIIDCVSCRDWDAILAHGCFVGPLQAKNLKVLTKDTTWKKMMLRFHGYWAPAIDEEHLTPDFFLDIGKETCPPQTYQAAPSVADANADAPAETLLYKRCCLYSYASGPR